jgi:hypothetical protein
VSDVLVDDVREALVAARPDVEIIEKRMFGGVAFMVEGRLVLSAGTSGDLLVRVGDDRSEDLQTRPGVSIGEMGGRSMGPRWLVVEATTIASPDELDFWVAEGLRSGG